jgi:hypothetical protein
MSKIFLLVVVGVMLGYAWCYSVPQAMTCDEVVTYPNRVENGIYRQGGAVCEIFLNEDGAERVKNTNQVTKEDRI